MLFRILFITTLFLLLVRPWLSQAQDRCGAMVYGQQLNSSFIQKGDRFEQWLNKKLQYQQKHGSQLRGAATTYRIPVVVHVIHNGETEGKGTNIPDEQILSQIAVLNKDYNRLNADATSTPEAFADVAGSVSIEFVLAKRTPEGLPTDGIVRVKGPKSSWTVNDNYGLKSLSYWPSQDYLNIWVCNLIGYIGYAQFPESDLLEGLENSSNNASTDGVVIAYETFGSADDGTFALDPNYNRGRTATHEIGHFFGLRHIWGDDSGQCENSGDYVDDTPDQPGETTGCPNHPRNNSCGTVTMFQNFMDYTYDACMNLFTEGQAERMTVVLENSPRRKSLWTSPGLLDPEPVPNDLGIKVVVTPSMGECEPTITPRIEVRNYGNNKVTSTQIQLKRNGTVVQTVNFTLNLDTLRSTQLSFSPLHLGSGQHILSFKIIQTNGVADGGQYNNEIARSTEIPQTITTPFFEDFDVLPSGWTIKNPDGFTTWALQNIPEGSGVNKAVRMAFYNYEDNLGEIDMLITPVFDLSDVPVALLTFNVAYAQFDMPLSEDGLKVVVLQGCNTDINQGTVIFERYGNSLATAPITDDNFVPTEKEDWETVPINLSAFLGESNIQLAFVGINDWGNNLYLDDIQVLTEPFENLTADKILSPSPVTCHDKVQPTLLVRNSGTDLTSFDVRYNINGIVDTVRFRDQNFPGGSQLAITLPAVTLNTGKNELFFELINPNGEIDLDPSDNFFRGKTIVNRTAEVIPFRESFEHSPEERWSMVNPTDGMPWQTTVINGNTAVYFNSFDNPDTDDKAWLVSPLLDFSKTTTASLFFDVSYALRTGRNDRLEVLTSKDCGNSFEVLKTYTGGGLSDSTVTTVWSPSTEDDWTRKYVNLSGLAGEDEVRLAFVVSNQNGNNLYLDNIEIYLSNDPTPLRIEGALAAYPTIVQEDYVNVTLNLPERENITLEVIDAMGRQVLSQRVPEALNQTLLLELGRLMRGAYFVKARTSRHVYVDRFFVIE